MKMLLLNTTQGLQPQYSDDVDEKKKLIIGKEYMVEIKKARNPQFHKKAFALFKIGCENSKSVDMPLKSYYKYAIAQAGFYTSYKTKKGVYVEPDSIAFENMDDIEFQEVYSKVLDFIIQDTGATKEDIENNLMSFF